MLRKAFTCALLAASSAICLLAQAEITGAGQTIINGHPLTEEQKIAFQRISGTPPLSGNFWYDARSGMWGYWGHEVSGVLPPGLDLGPLPSDASNGSTLVYINGRQLNVAELILFERLLGGPIQPCRAWLDGRTGNFGLEGSSVPVGRLAAPTNSGSNRGGIWDKGISNPVMTCTEAGNCYYPDR